MLTQIRKAIMSLKVFPIVKHPNPILTVSACPVTLFDDRLKKFAQQLMNTMRRSKGIGIAAPQVGAVMRVIAIDTRDVDHSPFVGIMINPEVVESKGKFKYLEGCLSMPNEWYWTERADDIVVRWQMLDGSVATKAFRGITSVCIQHEIDHLNGITMDKVGKKDG